MLTGKVFIFGAGYSARAFALAQPNDAIGVAGTTRTEAKFAALRNAGIKPFGFDGRTLTAEISDALRDTTHLIISIAPDEAGDPVLRAARQMIVGKMPRLAWIAYLSTVGVYGDHQGAWIDETTPCNPQSNRSRLRLTAEGAWLTTGREARVPVAILRLSGIYGPGRNAFVNLADGTARRLVKQGQVFNRIHVADIAGALWHLGAANTGGVFNVTDDLPAPPQDVVAYAAALMGVGPPAEIAFESAELSPMARSFYGENKRVSNAALKAAGYRFFYPNYYTALDAMWADSWWRGDPASDLRSPISAS